MSYISQASSKLTIGDLNPSTPVAPLKGDIVCLRETYYFTINVSVTMGIKSIINQ